ncbi:MAG: hypothetical protein AAFN41_08170 [Planctomycetota bacterium]
MAKRKAGIPEGFKLDIEKPADRPIRSGDFLDEIDGLPAGAGISTAIAEPPPASRRETPPPTTETKPAPKALPEPAGITPPPAKDQEEPATEQPPRKSPAIKRGKLNVSADGERRLDAIWDRMREFGPEKTLRKSEIIEALIIAAYDSRDQLDLSNVRRRGKYGSTTHKNFPIALAESVKRAIAETWGA